MRGRALCVGIACAILGCSRNDNRAGVTAAHPQRGKTYAVTLVTGDRVFYAVAADGTQSATVQPAPRAEGRPVAFYSSEWNGHLHVIPSDVAGDASIDPALFDVTQLVIERDDDESSSTLPLIVTSSEPAVRGTRALRMATSRELSSIGATALALIAGCGGHVTCGNGTKQVGNECVSYNALPDPILERGSGMAARPIAVASFSETGCGTTRASSWRGGRSSGSAFTRIATSSPRRSPHAT